MKLVSTKLIVAVLLVLCVNGVVNAETWYVTTKPGKNAGLGTKSDPFTNLAYAFNDKAANGDTILLTAGTHVSNACENFYAEKSNITIGPVPDAKVIFDCSKQSMTKNYGGINIASKASNVTIHDIEVINDLKLADDQRGVNNPIGIGIVVGGKGHVIRNCTVHSTWKAGIRVVSGAKDVSIIDCKVYDANTQNRNSSGGVFSPKGLPIGIQIAGIDIFNADKVTTTGNEVWNVYGEGLLLNKSRNITIANNVIHDVFSTSIYCDNGQSAKIYGNKIYSEKNEKFYRMKSPAVGIGISNENMNGEGTKDIEVYDNDISDARICLFYWKNPNNNKGTSGCNMHDNRCKAAYEALIRIMPDTHKEFVVRKNILDSTPTGIKLIEIPDNVKSEDNMLDAKSAVSTAPTSAASANGPPVITSPATIEGTEGQKLDHQITASNNPKNFSVKGKLPAGIKFDQEKGTFSGTPSAGSAGSFPISVKAYNSKGTGVKEIVLEIKKKLDSTP